MIFFSGVSYTVYTCNFFFLTEQMMCCSYLSPYLPLAASTTSTQFKMCLLQKFRNAIQWSLDTRQSTWSSVYVLCIARSQPCSPCVSVHINCPTEQKAEWIVTVTGVDTYMYSMRPTFRIVPELGVVRGWVLFKCLVVSW